MINNLPKFRIREKKHNVFLITILSGKYKKVSYSYCNINLVDNILNYTLDFYKKPEYHDDEELKTLTGEILQSILQTYYNSIKRD